MSEDVSTRNHGSLTSAQAHLPLSLSDMAKLLKYRRSDRVDPGGGVPARHGSVFGKIWNAPNTALGLAYGGVVYGLGAVMGMHPRVSLGHNAVQFTNNPLGGVGAITLGNATIYNQDPFVYSPDNIWFYPNGTPRPDGDVADGAGHGVADHEEQHTYQGELLGPVYLPSNLLGGLAGLLRDRDWHGPSNWNEAGPSTDPPRLWPK